MKTLESQLLAAGFLLVGACWKLPLGNGFGLSVRPDGNFAWVDLDAPGIVAPLMSSRPDSFTLGLRLEKVGAALAPAGLWEVEDASGAGPEATAGSVAAGLGLEGGAVA